GRVEGGLGGDDRDVGAEAMGHGRRALGRDGDVDARGVQHHHVGKAVAGRVAGDGAEVDRDAVDGGGGEVVHGHVVGAAARGDEHVLDAVDVHDDGPDVAVEEEPGAV